MRTIRFEHCSHVAASAQAVWAYHAAPGALERLSPPLAGFAVVDLGSGVAEGSLLIARVGWWPFARPWHALHVAVEPGVGFTDVAARSPMRLWVHRHSFEPVEGGTLLRDVIHFAPPRGVPRWLAATAGRLALDLLFRWRHRRTQSDLLSETQVRAAASAAGG